MVWIVKYKDLSKETIEIARLEADSYGKAYDKSKKVIKDMEENWRKVSVDFRFELLGVQPLETVFNWDQQ
ncbi:hypothetical protein [Priestia aryabhattai]